MDRERWHSAGIAMILLTLTVTLLALGAAGCDGSTAVDSTEGQEIPASVGGGPLRLIEANNGGHCRVKVGETIEVAIEYGPTTDYEWTAFTGQSNALLEQVGEPASVSADPGGTYFCYFTFTALAAGDATLRLVYARPWGGSEPLRTFEVAVTVE